MPERISKVTAQTMTISAYCASLCKPNPGEMKGSILAIDATDTILFNENISMGLGSNNQAEYFALLALLKKLQDVIGASRPTIKVFSDSLMMTNQVQGLWKVKGDLKLLHKKVISYKSIMPFTLTWVPSAQIVQPQ